MHFIRGKYSWVCLLSVMLASSGVLGTSAQAQSVEAEKEGLPLKPERKIEFTTDEGTWMSLDVSRDGKTILFELLGDLYTVPIAGGDAVGITSGMAFDSQARYSPDGEYITFVSDRGGSENVWIANVDGTDPKQLSSATHSLFVSPNWTPDGEYIIVTRSPEVDHIWSQSFEIWMYHIKGGRGIKITRGKSSSVDSDGWHVAMGAIASLFHRILSNEKKHGDPQIQARTWMDSPLSSGLHRRLMSGP